MQTAKRRKEDVSEGFVLQSDEVGHSESASTAISLTNEAASAATAWHIRRLGVV